MTPTLSRPEEFLSLFEVEPSFLDGKVGWLYDTVTFQAVFGADHVRFSMQASYGDAELEWRRTESGLERRLAYLALRDVVSYEAREANGKSELWLSFRDEKRGALVLQLRPWVALTWRMSE